MCWIWLYYNHSPPISTKRPLFAAFFVEMGGQVSAPF